MMTSIKRCIEKRARDTLSVLPIWCGIRIARVKKRYRMFLLISIIPVVNWITMGCALYCYNNLCYLKSRGRYEGNNIFRFILMVYAYIIPPIIIVQLAARINSLGDRILFGSKKK